MYCLKVKTVFHLNFLLATLSGLGLAILAQNSEVEVGWFFLMLVILARYSIAAAFNIVYIAHAQMFPTLFAVTSIGISNFAARLAIAIAPMVAEVQAPIPMSTFTAITLITAFASLGIREDIGAKNR